METNNYEELVYEFLRRWTDEDVKKMSLDEYMNVGNKDTFCYWVETKTRVLGSIQGNTAIKFGIYERKKIEKKDKRFLNDEKYTWLSGYGENNEIAFVNIKQDIIKIINFSKNGKFEQIDNIPLSNMFKWKIAYLYSNERLIPVFSIDVLIKIANHYGLNANNKTPISQIQSVMMLNKPSHLNVHEFMIRLCDEFNVKEKEVGKYLLKKQEGQNRIKRKASERKNTNTQIRTINRSFVAEQKHNKIQEKVKDLLIEQYGKENVILEENNVDIKLIQPDYITFYEVKSDSYASKCVREALGQIFFYSSNDDDKRPKKHIIVGQYPPNKDDIKYIEYLKENIKLELNYINVEIG